MDSVELLEGLRIVLRNTKYKRFDVIPADYVKTRLRTSPPYLYVINILPSYKLKMGHWVVWTCDENCNYEWFDSFATKPADYGVYFKEIAKLYPKCISRPLQSLNSSDCGRYCLFYSYFRAMECSMSKIVNKFSYNRHKNDLVVRNFYKNLRICKDPAETRKKSQCCGTKAQFFCKKFIYLK
jgi:hypothetical protein